MTSVAEAKGTTKQRGARWGFLLAALFVIAAFVTLAPGERKMSPATRDINGRSMGTTYSVRIAGAIDSKELARVAAALQREFDRVDRLMSTYDPASELSRFNRFRSTDPFSVTAP